MLENIKMEKEQVLEFTHLKMGLFTRGNSGMELRTVKAYLNIQTAIFMRESGRMI